MSCLASIPVTRVVAYCVLIGSWVMLGLICRLTIFLVGQRILSMVMGFFWSPEPHLYCVRFAYQLLGGTKVLELLLRTPHVRGQFYRLSSIIFHILGCVNYTHLFVWKVPFEVPHDCSVALFMVGIYFWDPFLMKRRSPLDALSSSTLSLLLASSNASAEYF
jgi:hypothetical protein